MYVFMVEYGELSQNYPCYCFLSGTLCVYVLFMVNWVIALSYFLMTHFILLKVLYYGTIYYCGETRK